jgi:ribosomal protein S5
MAYVATPLARVPVPRVVVPSRKLTVPLAVAGASVAVRVTLAPAAGTVLEAASVVVVRILVTATLRLLMTNCEAVEKKPNCVPLVKVEGSVA